MKLYRPKDDLAMKRISKISGEEGFTLIETVLALLLGMIITLSTASLFYFAVRFNSAAEERSRAMAVAQEEIERLRTLTFTELDNSTLAPQTQRTITHAGNSYTIQTTITAGPLRTITVNVTPQSGNGAWSVQPVQLVTMRSEPE
jgi:Tfp pilus assembly protein PilV